MIENLSFVMFYKVTGWNKDSWNICFVVLVFGSNSKQSEGKKEHFSSNWWNSSVENSESQTKKKTKYK